MSGDGGDENNNCDNDGNLHLCMVFVQELICWHIDFPQKCKQSMCVCGSKETMETTDSDNKQQNLHARRRRRWTTITTDDANQHLYTSNAHGCSTLAHRLFSKNTRANVRMRSHNKDGNDRIRRQTTKSSCKTTTAMKNCRYRRCQSASVHVELSWLFHIGT